MKKLFVVGIVALSMGAFAQVSDTEEYLGTGSLGAVSAGTTYKSYRHFSHAGELATTNTEMIIKKVVKADGAGKAFTGVQLDKILTVADEGDKFVLKYHLSPEGNRGVWADHYYSEAASSRSSASSYRTQAAQAMYEMENIYGYVEGPNGSRRRVVTGTKLKPLLTRMMNSQMYEGFAETAEREAMEFDRTARKVLDGRMKVSWMEFTKTLTGKDSGKSVIKGQMQGILDNGGKVFSLSHLDYKVVERVAKSNKKGWMFAVPAVISGMAAGYNAMTGDLSNAVNGGDRLTSDRSSGKRFDGYQVSASPSILETLKNKVFGE